jgi:hypothetical protein
MVDGLDHDGRPTLPEDSESTQDAQSKPQHAPGLQTHYLSQHVREGRKRIGYLGLVQMTRDNRPSLDRVIFRYEIGAVRRLPAFMWPRHQDYVSAWQAVCLAHAAVWHGRPGFQRERPGLPCRPGEASGHQRKGRPCERPRGLLTL